MEMIEQVVKMGKQAIVLIPEIALTYQTVMRFYGRFGDQGIYSQFQIVTGRTF